MVPSDNVKLIPKYELERLYIKYSVRQVHDPRENISRILWFEMETPGFGVYQALFHREWS